MGTSKLATLLQEEKETWKPCLEFVEAIWILIGRRGETGSQLGQRTGSCPWLPWVGEAVTGLCAPLLLPYSTLPCRWAPLCTVGHLCASGARISRDRRVWGCNDGMVQGRVNSYTPLTTTAGVKCCTPLTTTVRVNSSIPFTHTARVNSSTPLTTTAQVNSCTPLTTTARVYSCTALPTTARVNSCTPLTTTARVNSYISYSLDHCSQGQQLYTVGYYSPGQQLHKLQS